MVMTMEQQSNERRREVVILAGGMGSRLAPITDDLPKPLVPVCGTPVLTRLTDCLKRNGWKDALLTVCALPEAFDLYRDPNIELETVKGSVPLGSAGSVRAVRDRLADTILVISGDTVTDFDLRRAYERHKKERPMQAKYKRILLKISGEALAGEQRFGLNEEVIPGNSGWSRWTGAASSASPKSPRGGTRRRIWYRPASTCSTARCSTRCRRA